jgi:hypothetical protein
MSPEVMCGQNHTIAVDYFALGVLAFEFMFGYVIFFKRYFNSGLMSVRQGKK